MRLVVPLLAVLLGTASASPRYSSGFQHDGPWTIFDAGVREQWKEKRYGMEDGLPSLQANAVEHGPDGRLWVGTTGGLVTFDGVQFRFPDHRYVARQGASGETVMSPATGMDASTDTEYVTALFCQGDDRMWAGTASGELRCYVGSECQIIQAEDSMPWVGLIQEASDGAIWAGGDGLLRVTSTDVTVIFDDRDPDCPAITGLASDPDAPEGSGTLWISTTAGVFHWNAVDGLTQVDSEFTRGVFFDLSGRRWRLSRTAVEVDGHSIFYDLGSYSDRLLDSIQVDSDRTLLVFDGQSLLYDFNGGKLLVTPLGDLESVRDAARGPGDSLWIASGSVGLRFIERETFRSVPVPIPGAEVFVVEPTPEGSVVIGSDFSPDLWLARPTRSNLSGTPLERLDQRSEPPVIKPEGNFSLVMESERSGWLATTAGTLRMTDGTLRRMAPDLGKLHDAGRVCRTESGSVWARDGGKLKEYRDSALTGRSFDLPVPVMTKLIADGDDLIAFQNEVVVRFSTETMTSETIIDVPGSRYGSVFLHANGDLWISSDGHGLYRLRPSGDVDQWTVQHGLPTRFLGAACTVPGPTESTHLWLNTNAGVLAIAFDSLEGTARGERELLRFHMFHTGESLGAESAALDTGIVVFPTVMGPIAIDTHQPLPSSEPPMLSTATIWADGMKLMEGTELRGRTDLEFEYYAAQFPFRRSSLVQFRLEGHDADWHDGGQDRSARYTALPPGNYQFRLRSRATGSGFGPVTSGPLLVISPYWHQRLGVRIGLLAAFLLMSLMFFRGRTRRLLRHSEALEAEIVRREGVETDLSRLRGKEVDLRRQLARAEEAERSRLARELHDDFSQRLAALSISLQLAGETLRPEIGPDQHASLVEAQVGIEQLATDVHALSRQLHPAVLDDLGLSAALRSECKMRGARMTANLSMDDDGNCIDVRGEVGLAFFRVAQEALQNAAKHSGAKTVRVDLRQNDANIQLTIHDDGGGFDQRSGTQRGLGLSSMRERMNLVGGELSVRSEPGEGTRVCAKAPLAARGSSVGPKR